MKKKARIAWLAAVALLAAPLGAMGPVSTAEAEESGTEKIQLDTPTNLRWGRSDEYQGGPNDKYAISWEGINLSVDEYGSSSWNTELYKDGQYLTSWGLGEHAYEYDHWDGEAHGWIYTDVPNSKHTLASYTRVIFDSGSYTFRVRARAQYDDEAYRDSEWSEWSESIAYVRPEREMATVPKVTWDAEEAGVCHFLPLVDSTSLDHYEVALYVCTDGTYRSVDSRWLNAEDYMNRGVIDVDFSGGISALGEGKYYVTVQAFSNDIDTVAHGRESEPSEILDTTMNADKLSEILSGAADKTAVETKELLTSGADLSAIQQAMQTSDSFRGQIQELEGRYAEEQGIQVEAPAVSDAAKEYVDSEKVSVVGAAFNAAQGQAVNLQMDVTPEANRVPTFSGYRKNVQLDIRLVSDSAEVHTLSMPVSVTMPIPQGINASQLVILHYHADGTTERTAFHVNGDGTITFTVKSFSTFVFAEQGASDPEPEDPTPDAPAVDDPTPDVPENPTPDTPAVNDPASDTPASPSNQGRSGEWWLESLVAQITAAAPGSTVKVTKEQDINALSGNIMQRLVKRGDVSLEMEYTYQGTDYHIFIPAGKAPDDDIPWYGPLYLAAYFSADGAAGTDAAAGTIVVQKGDTLSGIARRYHTTLAHLAAANPQIKDLNRIVPGQIIKID